MTEKSKIKDWGQKRANKAFSFVEEIKKKSPKRQKEYKSWVKKMPAMIKTNGLGQTLAFYETHNEQIYKDLAEWLHTEKFIDSQNLIQELLKKESPEYRQITNEVMAILLWLRRFVDTIKEE
jgi:CRISPR-associated protein Cmr5